MDDLLSIAVSNAVAATVLALAAIAVGAIYRRPALVHGLWLLVLLKLVTPPLVFIPVSWPTTAELPPREVAAVREETINAPLLVEAEPATPDFASPAGEPDCVSAPREASTALDPAAPPHPDALGALTQPLSPGPSLWPQVLRIVWAAGALIWFLVALERLDRFRRLLRFARPAPVALQERTRRLAQALGLKRCPRVRLMPGRLAPMLWAVGGPPRLLMPADLLGTLSEEQLDTLLVHELAHLRRRDHWVRILEFVVMGLYWWHPVVWYARRELREAEEQCCDAWVVSMLPDTGRTYATALLETLDFLSTAQAAVPPLASGLGHIADLKRRLTMIMQGNTPRALTWPGCLAVITLGLTCLPLLPSLRGEPPTKEEAREEIERAEKALEKAKAELERQQADLAKKGKELAKVHQRLAEESVRKARIVVEERAGRLVIVDGEDKAAYRIEITLPADENLNPKEIVAKIRKVLPEDLRNKVVIHPVPTTNRNQNRRGEPPTRAGGGPPQSPPPAQSNTPRAKPPANTTHAPGTWYYEYVPPSKSSDKRINELEKKLEKVLQELQELRKQMKQPRGGPALPGAVPAAGAYAPPERPIPYPVPAPGTTAPGLPADLVPGTVAPPAPASPAPPAAPPSDPSARRLPNPYGEYRSVC